MRITKVLETYVLHHWCLAHSFLKANGHKLDVKTAAYSVRRGSSKTGICPELWVWIFCKVKGKKINQYWDPGEEVSPVTPIFSDREGWWAPVNLVSWFLPLSHNPLGATGYPQFMYFLWAICAGLIPFSPRFHINLLGNKYKYKIKVWNLCNFFLKYAFYF